MKSPVMVSASFRHNLRVSVLFLFSIENPNRLLSRIFVSSMHSEPDHEPWFVVLSILIRSRCAWVQMEFPEEIKSFLFVLALVQVVGYFDLARPQNVPFILSFYIISQILLLVVCYIIRSRVQKKNDSKTITVKQPRLNQTEPEDTIEMTVRDYDVMKIGETIRGYLFPIPVLLILYWKWGSIQPFIIQTVIPWRAMTGNPLVRIHLFGHEAEGDLTRPFAPPRSSLSDWFQDADDSNPLPKAKDVQRSRKAVKDKKNE